MHPFDFLRTRAITLSLQSLLARFLLLIWPDSWQTKTEYE